MKEIFEKIVTKTQDYLVKNNLKAMILGFSGGIDSTVVGIICHEVQRRSGIPLIGVSLPSGTNKKEENDIAQAFSGICNSFITHSIEADYEFLRRSFQWDFTERLSPIQEGNIKARLRMMYLYNLASMNGGLVMDTDNLTEHYLGFFTIHGDQGDLNPIGDLWKTEVYELGQWMLENLSWVPKEALVASLNITPTDGNGVKEGGDLEQIAPGLTYKDVDEILKLAIEDKDIPNPSDKTEMVIKRYKGSEFKRKNLPIKIPLKSN